jgi:capsular exopolysaccharide synthesis family protein
MSDEAGPLQRVVPTAPPAAAAQWDDASPPAPARSPLERPLAAIRRYKYLAGGIFLLCVGAGLIATRFLKPLYEVRATVWIASETPLQDKSGPIRSNELLSADAWVELLRSYRIADAVVRQLSLYVKPAKDDDAPLVRSLEVADRFVPGTYTLDVDKSRDSWRLSLENTGVLDSGSVRDSIGRKLGLRWMLSAAQFARLRGHHLEFTVSTPRETSVELMKRLSSRLPEKSNFLWLSLQDQDPQLAARTLNTWSREFVSVAGDLKRRNLVEFAKILATQVQYAESNLHDAESALENFRVQTITLPQEGGPVAAGVEATRDPALKAFFDKKIEYDNLRNDRESLERALASAASGAAPYESVLLIPSVAQSLGGEQLRESFKTLYTRQAELAAARQIYTDNFSAVRDLVRAVDLLKTQTIPQQATQLLGQLKTRESEYNQRISSASTDLQAIPARTIEEMRLRRAVSVSEALYTTLKNRYAEAQLAEASSIPDINILDSAIAPLRPTKNTAPEIVLFSVLGGLGLGIGLAILLDKLDGRLRYPEQAINDLGLAIAGTIPVVPKGGLNQQSTEQITQLVESFRTLRMSVLQTLGTPAAVAITSPSPGDGKSFVSANLAMSFADAGFRTLLVDGDTRRGSLHTMFDLPRTPGLTDLLAGDVTENDVVHRTSNDKLSVLPAGHPRRGSPELLTSPRLTAVVAHLRGLYDVVVVDTPPLAAGIDGYAIASATGSAMIVLRVGQTERRMAAAKLLLVDRLPIQLLGAVLNSVPSSGEYAYYGYVEGYDARDELPESLSTAVSVATR